MLYAGKLHVFPIGQYISNKAKKNLSFIYAVLPSVANVFNIRSKKERSGDFQARESQDFSQRGRNSLARKRAI